ncbi:MAG: stage III sporulation protein AE [Clostridium sp.]
MIILLTLVFLGGVNTIITGAEDDGKYKIEDQNEIDAKTIGLDSLYDYIKNIETDTELLNELDPMEYFKAYLTNGEGNITFSDIAKAAVSILFREVKTVLKLAMSLAVVAILCSLLKNLQGAFKNQGVSNVAFYACYAILIMMLAKSFLVSVDVAKDVIYEVSNFIGALFPVIITMIGMAGGVAQAAAIDPIVLGAVSIIPRLYTTIIIPLILINFVLQFANNLSEEHKIDNLCKLSKTSVMWMQGFIITVFIGMLTIRGITSNTIDAVALKATKFAVDNFIPIVGKAFSDAITSVAGYSLIIKNAISAIGLIVVILLILYPIIKIVLMGFVYKISAALVEPISDKRITASIAAAGDAMTMILSCVLSVSLMFFVLLGIFAATGKYIVGG